MKRWTGFWALPARIFLLSPNASQMSVLSQTAGRVREIISLRNRQQHRSPAACIGYAAVDCIMGTVSVRVVLWILYPGKKYFRIRSRQ